MPNVLNRIFGYRTFKVWVSDITYIRVKEGFLYLTTVLDYDRKIIGWSLSSGMSVEETSLAAWRMAIKTEASQRDCYFILTEVFNTPVKFTNVVDSYKIITRV
jgi:transposase InsO family protein